MFGIGLHELIIILVLALIVVGPKKLPEIARSLGKAMAELRRATDDIKRSIEIETDDIVQPEDHYPLKPEVKGQLYPPDDDQPTQPENSEGADQEKTE